MHILWRTEAYRSLGKIDVKDVKLISGMGRSTNLFESVDLFRTSEQFSGWKEKRIFVCKTLVVTRG